MSWSPDNLGDCRHHGCRGPSKSGGFCSHVPATSLEPLSGVCGPRPQPKSAQTASRACQKLRKASSVRLPIGSDEVRLFSDQFWRFCCRFQLLRIDCDRARTKQQKVVCQMNSGQILTNCDRARAAAVFRRPRKHPDTPTLNITIGSVNSGGRGSTLTQPPHRKPALTITIESAAVPRSLRSKPTSRHRKPTLTHYH